MEYKIVDKQEFVDIWGALLDMGFNTLVRPPEVGKTPAEVAV